MQEETARAFAQFFDTLPAVDAPYTARDVERELPFDQETYPSFQALDRELDAYRTPEPDYADDVSGRTLTGILEQSEGAVDTAVLEANTATDRDLQSPDDAAAELATVNDRLFDDNAQKSGVDPYRYDPFLMIDDHGDYLSYTAIVVGAENHLGCNERKLVLPSAMQVYRGTIDAPAADTSTVVEDATGNQTMDGTPYSKYETTMDRLADDVEHMQDLVGAAEEYELLHPDCDRGTYFVDPPETLRDARADDIVDAVTALGQTAEGFSADVVRMKLANNGILLTDMLDTDADEIADTDARAPRDRYLADHPDTPLRHALPGLLDGEPRGLPLARPAHEPYRELVEQVTDRLADNTDPVPAIEEWAQNRAPEQTDEPDHVSRTYQ